MNSTIIRPLIAKNCSIRWKKPNIKYINRFGQANVKRYESTVESVQKAEREREKSRMRSNCFPRFWICTHKTQRIKRRSTANLCQNYSVIIYALNSILIKFQAIMITANGIHLYIHILYIAEWPTKEEFFK